MKKLILTSLLCALSLGTFAQEDKEVTKPEKVKGKKITLNEKGDFLVSLLLGNGQYSGDASTTSGNSTVYLNTPNTGVITTNDNSLVNMIGAEGRYFVTDKIAVKLSGGLILNNTPGRDQIDATGATAGVYAVEADESINLNFTPGAEYHFDTKSKRLSPYVGLSIPFYYSRNTSYTTAYTVSNGSVSFVDAQGKRQAIILGVGTQTFAGFDYHINEDIYFGVQINALGYNYTYQASQSGEGLDLGQADTSNFNMFTQPVLKFGIKL